MSAEDSDFGRHEIGNADELGFSRTRTRVSRACTRCRSRKDKCDGARPSCAACLSSSQPCSYEPSTKKRGLPEGYVRGLEKLWAVLVAKIDGLEDTVAQILDEHRDILLEAWNHRQTGEELHSMWKDSRVLQELETLLAALDNASVHGTKRKRDKNDDDVAAEDGSPNLQLLLATAYNVQMHQGTNQTASSHSTRSYLVRPQSQLDKVVLPSVASEFLGQYFRFTHCWMPILDKPRMLRCCYEFSRAPTSVDQSNADLAVLAAALAYVYQYSGTHGELSGSDLSLGGLNLSQLCRKCMPPVEVVYQLGHIQALLILALYDIGKGLWEPAWRSVGVAVRGMQGIREALPMPSKDYSATQQMCLILETLVALRLSRRPHMSSLDLPAICLLNEDGHEEWEPWVNPDLVSSYTSEPSFTLSCFNRLTRIFVILNDFLRDHAARPQEAIVESLQALERLAEGYPFRLTDSSLRPPHQLWLKTTHLLACAYVAAAQAGQRSLVMKSLDSVNGVLQTWTSSYSVGLAAMPTFIFGLLCAISDPLLAGAHSQIAPSTTSGLGLIADQLYEVQAHWPEAGTLAKTVRAHLKRPEEFSDHNSNMSAKRRRGPTLPPDPIETQHGSLNLWPSDPFTQTFANNPQPLSHAPTSRYHVRTRASTHPFASDLQIASNSSGPAQDIVNANFSFGPSGAADLRNMSLDGATGGYDAGQHHPSIARSPSFQGDEIDALFREMAQLDTTEWTSGRSQALKDFGFYDDTTFEAFCNDPDRLNNSTNSLSNQQMSAINSGNTLPFDPGFVSQPLGTALDEFDMVGSSWNG